jgi:pre-mRNA-splicing factor CDC5/CEF1
LSINANGAETPLLNGTSKLSLKESLTNLPKPLNDFEIALPEEEEEVEQDEKKRSKVDDQQDVDDMTIEEKRRAAQERWKRENQVIQRALPRPGGINTSVLRSNLGDFQLTALQTAEEKIKEEMVLLLKHDSKKHPLGSKPPQSGNLPELSIYSDEELEKSRALLKREVETVKKGMNHGDLTLDAYSQVWEECYREVMFNVGQSKYTRASMSSKKDRIEFLEKALDVNRQLMTKEAKQAAKIEKKLKVILGGYQAKAMALCKQIEEINDQLDTVSVENVTYSKLRETEQSIIPYRLQKLQEHLHRQTDREKGLQEKFRSLLDQRKELTIEIAKLGISPL